RSPFVEAALQKIIATASTQSAFANREMRKNREHGPRASGPEPGRKNWPRRATMSLVVRLLPVFRAPATASALPPDAFKNGAEYTDGPIPRQAICRTVFSRFFK